ncbi:MAG: heavy metal-responsive transcriptional regulator [Candidatus Binatia bacterium]
MEGLKIGQVAKATGLTAKTIRYYELLGLLREAARTESGYRVYGDRDVARLKFITKAKGLALSLTEIKDILALYDQRQRPCIHVLALLDKKLEEIDTALRQLQKFRDELVQLREESAGHLESLSADAAICGIIERGVHLRGEQALVWLESHRRGKRRE